jgi:hypothetical protein
MVSSVKTSLRSYYKSALILSLDPNILKYSGALGAKLSAKSEYLSKNKNSKQHFMITSTFHRYRNHTFSLAGRVLLFEE